MGNIDPVFALAAAITVGAGLLVVTQRNPIYSAISMLACFLGLAVVYLRLEAPFLAAIHVLVYTGAILVLFLFVLMLLNIGRERAAHATQPTQRWVALIGAAFFAGFLGMLLWRTHGPDTLDALTPDYLSIHRLSWELFTTWLLPFELVGLLLLVAVVAAYTMARAPQPGEMTPPAQPGVVATAAAAEVADAGAEAP